MRHNDRQPNDYDSKWKYETLSHWDLSPWDDSFVPTDIHDWNAHVAVEACKVNKRGRNKRQDNIQDDLAGINSPTQSILTNRAGNNDTWNNVDRTSNESSMPVPHAPF